MAMLRHILKLLILSDIMLYCAFSTYANNEQVLKMDDITIKSDKLIMDQTKSISYFTGNVLVYYGDMILQTQALRVEFIEQNGTRAVNKVFMPYNIKAIKKDTNEVLVADKAEYDGRTKKLAIIGNVYVQIDDRIVKCDEFIYDTRFQH